MAGSGALPDHGRPADEVLAEVAAMRQVDLPTHGGTLFAYVYDPGIPGLDDLAAAAYALAAQVNGLNPTVFPSLLAMENALVGAVAAQLNAPDTAAGSMTSGGTESLLLAVKAARDAVPGALSPGSAELVLPVTAHAAFAMAAEYLGVRLVPVPVSPLTLVPSPDDIAAAITNRTVLVACSAPSYAHGVIDPVTEIAAAAAARGVRCHVDACFGGWVLPYLRRLGVPVPPFGFSVPGVTSISVDLHKYAYCPKGTSVLVHRTEALRAAQFFAYADWPGYTMVNPTVASTRPGGPIAGAWATMRFLGDDGYLRLAQSTLDAVRSLAGAVSAVDGLDLLPETGPQSTVVCFTGRDPDLFVLVDELSMRGWYAQPQLAYVDLPRSVHLTVTAAVAPRAPEFAAVLGESVAAARAHGPVQVPGDLLAVVAKLTPAQFSSSLVDSMSAALGLGGGGTPLPERQAVINALVELAPVPVREALLAGFLSSLQRPAY
jgi:glutamate/tyrosine decarboxylase-like PLP-dependent enzyme